MLVLSLAGFIKGSCLGKTDFFSFPCYWPFRRVKVTRNGAWGYSERRVCDFLLDSMCMLGYCSKNKVLFWTQHRPVEVCTNIQQPNLMIIKY